MSKSAIYTAMTTSTAVAAGGTIPLGTIVRRYGQNLNLNGNGITLSGNGYYEVNVAVTAAVTAEGEATVQLYKDGTAVPGAAGTVTAAGAGDYVTITFPALVRLQCCNNYSNLTLVLTAGASTITNVALVVEKI